MNTEVGDYDSILKKNFYRNQQLIDLTFIPQDLYERIISEYKKDGIKDRSKILNYMIKNKLSNLTEYITEF